MAEGKRMLTESSVRNAVQYTFYAEPEADRLFDAWLAERERKVAERTWDEAVYHLEAVVGSEMRRQAMRDNPYRREASS